MNKERKIESEENIKVGENDKQVNSYQNSGNFFNNQTQKITIKEEPSIITKKEVKDIEESAVSDIKIDCKFTDTPEEAKQFRNSNENNFSKIELTESIFINDLKICNEKENANFIDKDLKTPVIIEEIKQTEMFEENHDDIKLEVIKEIKSKDCKEKIDTLDIESKSKKFEAEIKINETNNKQIVLIKEEDRKIKSFLYYKKLCWFLFLSSSLCFLYYILGDNYLVNNIIKNIYFMRLRNTDKNKA